MICDAVQFGTGQGQGLGHPSLGCAGSSVPANPATGILSRYSKERDAVNHAFDQIRDAVRSQHGTQVESDDDDSVNVPDTGDFDQQERIRELEAEGEARAAAHAAQQLEQERNREAADLIRDANNLMNVGDVDCAALMSTYYSGRAPSLPLECMTDTDRMSVYAPGTPQPLTGVAPDDPAIDGSNIPSGIDFSPSLQQLTNQILSSVGVPAQSGPMDSLLAGMAQPNSGSTPAASSLTAADGGSSQGDGSAEAPSALDRLSSAASGSLDAARQAAQDAASYVMISCRRRHWKWQMKIIRS
jgi:hypothetical protein